MKSVYDNNAYSLKGLEYWTHQFRLGRKMLEDEKRSGRQPLDDIDAQILKKPTNEPFSPNSGIASACNVSPSTIYTHLNESLGYKNYILKLVPYLLKSDL